MAAQPAITPSTRKPTPARAAAKRSRAIIESDDDDEGDVPANKVLMLIRSRFDQPHLE